MSIPAWKRPVRDVVGFLVAILAAVFTSSLLQASRVRSVNLEEMTQRVERIFSGRCVGVRVMEDPDLGIEVTLITFAVDRAVKGPRGRTVTVKMLGGRETGSERGAGVAGMPRFRRGEEVVLFLYGTSSSGLTSPVGLGQGKFALLKDKQGRHIASNGFGNRTLFRGLSPEAAKRLGKIPRRWKGRRGIPPDALLSMVESLKP